MEGVGDEKRIQALFSELAVQDQFRAPRFERLWSRAEIKRSTPARYFSKARVAIVVTVVMIVAAIALTAWSWFSAQTKSSLHNAVNVPTIIPRSAPGVRDTGDTSGANNSDSATLAVDRPRSHPPRKKRSLKFRVTDSAVTDAALLSRWQSPTDILMQSPASVVWNSLPQLNESAEELKQFLPKNHEATKESNQ